MRHVNYVHWLLCIVLMTHLTNFDIEVSSANEYPYTWGLKVFQVLLKSFQDIFGHVGTQSKHGITIILILKFHLFINECLVEFYIKYLLSLCIYVII